MSIWMNVLLAMIGLGGGMLVAGGLFAFLVTVGVVTRLAAGTKTAKFVMLYEDMALLGGAIGNIAYVYGAGLPTGVVGFALYGISSGIFTGCLAAALAEVINMLPVLSERLNMKKGMAVVMVAFAIGKLVGAWVHLIGGI
ncbi:MAG: stage V sporulation protein AB [Lachnospiraceae bacterium]|nr:stage V sporulation protein AB [Lachnospiraceae bacterium]